MSRMTTAQALEIIDRHRTDEVVIATMTAGSLWPQYSRSSRDFTHTAPMGSAPSIGLGVALGRPDLRVIVLDGDGSLRMNLGVLVTVGQEAPPNLVHVVFENGVYNLTGGQPVSGSDRPNTLVDIARATGYRNVHAFEDVESLDLAMNDLLLAPGPTFVSLRVSPALDIEQARAVSRSPAAQAKQSRRGWKNLHTLLNSPT
ncbi:MAG: thiamine pyrophosphate-dependent enzyme [Dehalococcoidia bacterium]|nr:thiamine pyrophosphate-dependent enzyme [Dehalococcoidia bacterium]